MPGSAYNSIQNPRQYRALRRRGYSKEAAARISNARTPGHTVKARTRITGNLFRDESGRFSGGSGGESPSTEPAEPTARQQRQEEERAIRAQEDEAEAALRAEEDARLEAAPRKGRNKLRAEIARDRRRRAMARKLDRAERKKKNDEQSRAERAAELAKPKPEKPKKGGGGGKGKKPTPTDEEKRAATDAKKRQTAADTAGRVGLKPAEVDALRTAAEGGKVSEAEIDGLAELGFVVATGDNRFEATDQGRRALSALERGDVRAYQAAVQDAAAKKKPKQPPKPDVQAKPVPAPKRDVQAKPVAPRRPVRQPIRRPIARDVQIAKDYAPLFVFKDSSGRDRWVSVTTTAYQDKDREWISRKAISEAVARGDAGNPRGPLRFWHVPGLDFGECDYQATAQDGRFLIESGTCKSEAHARVVREAARRGYQMSPGFFHPRTEPRAGVFNHIVIFERSFVPPGRASNPWTRLLVKDTRMLTDEKKKEFETLAGDAGGREFLSSLLATVAATDKTAQEQATFKDAPEWAQGLLSEVRSLSERVKAFETKAPMPAEEMIEAGETEMEDGMEEDPALLDDGGADEPFLTLADVQMIVDGIMASLGPVLELEKKMAGYANDIKAHFANTQATKDDERAREIATLKEEQAKNAARLAILEGEQPVAVKNRRSPEGLGGPEFPAEIGQLLKQHNGEQPTDPLSSFLSGFGVNGARTPGGN